MRKLSLVVICLLTLSLVSCTSSSFEKYTLTSLSGTGAMYEAIDKTATNLYDQGKITEAQKDQYVKYATDFQVSWNTAKHALQIYAVTKNAENQDKLDVAFAAFQAALGDFTTFYKTLIK